MSERLRRIRDALLGGRGEARGPAAAAAAAPPVNIKRRRSSAGLDGDGNGGDGGDGGLAGLPVGVTQADVDRLGAEIDRRWADFDGQLDRLQTRPSLLVLDRATRAVMRTMLFRAGRRPGAPVRRADLVAAVNAALAAATTEGGGAPAPGGGRSARPANLVSLAIAGARARFAADLALDLVRVNLLPVADGAGGGGGGRARGGGGGGGSGSAGTEAYALRTLLPPATARIVDAAGAAGVGGGRPPVATGLGLLAAAIVRLGGTPTAGGGAAGVGGGGVGGGPSGPVAGPNWMAEPELWEVLGGLGVRRAAAAGGPGTLEAAWAGVEGGGSASDGAAAAGPASHLIPGLGDPEAALRAAVDARWLVERFGPAPDGSGGRVRWFTVGEAALGEGGGGAELDAFIRMVFESPDPVAELAECLGGGGE